ncbi:hypothetical protein [Brevibacillus sp. NRS-1366]|uniref:hypothetical protein n=1 Tax=Brevibacillus sp. NRS-1366 TaxID=3233899 RepID=UPI003D22C400
MNRTIGATVNYEGSMQGNTFKVFSFNTGSASTIRLEGKDWDYFFETDTFQGTDEDKSLNRTFTVSDGVHTVKISLEEKFADMDELVGAINDELMAAQISGTARIHFSHNE